MKKKDLEKLSKDLRQFKTYLGSHYVLHPGYEIVLKVIKIVDREVESKG